MLINKEKNIEIETSIEPSHTIIWLHGLGADAQDSLRIVTNLDVRGLNLRFVCPSAQNRCISVNNGMKMHAWYDIKSNVIDENEDIAGIKESFEVINGLINKEKSRGIAPSNIILGGFSQGCALALFVGLSITEKIRGIIALSGYLPIRKYLISKLNNYQDLPIFVGHGIKDLVIPPSYPKEYIELLRGYGYKNIKSSYYCIDHSICMDELKYVSNAIKEMVAGS